MSGRKPIFYSALMLTGVNLLLRFTGTCFQVYLSSVLGPSGIGLLQLVLSVGSLAMIASIAGVRTAAMYLTAEELGRGRAGNALWVLSGSFLYSTVCSGIVSVGLYFSAPWIAEVWIGDIRTLDALRLFAVFLPVSCLCAVMTGYFTAANRIGTLAIVEIAEQLCVMAVTVIALTFWAGKRPERACMSVIAGSCAGACLTLGCLILLRLREKSPHSPRIPVGRRLLRSAVPLAAADVLKSGISTTENLMVPRRLGLCAGVTDPLAAFGTLSGMVFPVLMFPACIIFGLAELLIPELARCAAAGSRSRIRYLVRRSLKAAMLYGTALGGLLQLLAVPLCQRLYGNTEAGYLLARYALLVPMLYCDAITDAMTKGLGQQTACVRYNILTSAMDVGLLYLLLPRYGMEGYLFSFTLTHLVNFLLSLRQLLTISDVRLPLRNPLLTLAASGAALSLASTLPGLLLPCLGFLLLLGSMLYLCGILRREDAVWARRLMAPACKR